MKESARTTGTTIKMTDVTMTFGHGIVSTPGETVARILGVGVHTIVVVNEKPKLCKTCVGFIGVWDDGSPCLRCRLTMGLPAHPESTWREYFEALDMMGGE